MQQFNPDFLKKLYIPPPTSHKGQNGKLMIIGGSHLFHGASLWALKIASRVVDMVFYSSVPTNNEIVQKAKEEFRDGIVVPREKLDEYIKEVDVVLIGPGLPREEGREGQEESTRALTERLLKEYPDKKWVIDAGSLTEIEPDLLKKLNGNVIVTPHRQEFEKLFSSVMPNSFRHPVPNEILKQVQDDSKKYNVVILLKGATDIVASPTQAVTIAGGNAGMTKGGTGDVLAGLVAALACKNDMFLAAAAGSFLNKKAGESLAKRVGIYFNASDLADEIPKVMKENLGK